MDLNSEIRAQMQPFFDRAVGGVLAQGCLSRRAELNTTCYYRHPDNASVRCGVGHLIADEHYVPELEGEGYGNKHVRQALIASGVPVPTAWVRHDHLGQMLSSIQSAHDSAFDLEKFRDKARGLAERLGLSAAVCDEVPA